MELRSPYPRPLTFDLWSLPGLDPQVVYGHANPDERLDAWRLGLRRMMGSVGPPAARSLDLVDKIQYRNQNLFSLANTLVRRGWLDKDEVSALALLIFG